MTHEAWHTVSMGLGLVVAVAAAAESPRFVGVLAIGGRCWYALAEPGRPARWVETGHSFEGYRVSSYRPDDSTLLLLHDHAESRVPLEPGGDHRPLLSAAAVHDFAEKYFSATHEGRLQVAEPRLFRGSWLIIGHRDIEGRTETHALLVSRNGVLLESVRNPPER